MGIKMMTVATCDGPPHGEALGACPRTVVLQVEGRTLCEVCFKVMVDDLIAGLQEGPLTVEKFDSNYAPQPDAAANQRALADGLCPDCGAGPLKALSAHRRKYHNKFVRGPRAVHEPPAGMGKLSFDAAEEAEKEAAERARLGEGRTLAPIDEKTVAVGEEEGF